MAAARSFKNLTALKRLPNRYEGPVLFTDVDGTSVLFGPLNDPLNTVFNIVSSAGGKQGHVKALAFGPSSMLTSLPQGYSTRVVLVVGDGATESIGRYGPLLSGNELQYRSHHFFRSRIADPFVDKISAWTDNGAYYFYAGEQTKTMPPAQSTLPQWLSNLSSSGIAVESLQLDGWWMNQTTSAPNANIFPYWETFRNKLGEKTNLLLYKAFFSGKYDLFEKYEKVQSPKGVWYPSGEDAYGFYGDLLDAFKKLGGTNFETDFMSDHLLPTPGLANHVDGLRLYHEGLTKAALERNIPVQFCMPTVCQILAAANYPAVTNARVSTDYATERIPRESSLDNWVPTYVIGLPDLLLWSIGLAPSKDIVATTIHQPGGGIKRDNYNVEMDYVLAILSGGPVGLGDGIKMTNVSLTRAGIRKDGTILKASKPLTAVDSTFVPSSKPSGFIGFLPLTTDGDCTSSSPCSPSLGQTHASIPLTQSYLEALNIISEKYATWHSLLSMHLGSFSPPTNDLFPAVSKEFPISSYREWRWQKCVVNSKPTKECLIWQSVLTSGMPDVSSGERRADSTGADAWRLFHFFPNLPVPGNPSRENRGFSLEN